MPGRSAGERTNMSYPHWLPTVGGLQYAQVAKPGVPSTELESRVQPALFDAVIAAAGWRASSIR